MQEEEEGDMAGKSSGLRQLPRAPARGTEVGAVVRHRLCIPLPSEFQLRKVPRPAGQQRSSALRIFHQGVFLFFYLQQGNVYNENDSKGPGMS